MGLDADTREKVPGMRLDKANLGGYSGVMPNDTTNEYACDICLDGILVKACHGPRLPLEAQELADELAKALVRLVTVDRNLEPARYAEAASWSDLHDACDANEYLIEACDELGYDLPYDDEGFALVATAIEQAEAELFGLTSTHKGARVSS